MICFSLARIRKFPAENDFVFTVNRSIFRKMLLATMASSTFTSLSLFLSLIENCKNIKQVKQIHSQTITAGLASDSSVQKKLVLFFCTRIDGNMGYAYKVFEKMHEPGVLIWNSMIKGYSREGQDQKGVLLYIGMLNRGVKPDTHTFPFLFKGFRIDTALVCGRELHCHVVKLGLGSNVFVQNALVHMYSLCRLMDMARRVFDMSSKEDVFAWNGMLSGYNRINRYRKSLQLFNQMEKMMIQPTSITLLLVLSACSKLKDLDLCHRVYEYVKEGKVEANLKVENALIDAFAACREMDIAVRIFNSMKTRDVISWTVVVKMFLDAGNIDLARHYFDQMPERDGVSWTAMIDGYNRANRFKESSTLFHEMQASNIEPDEFTVVSVLTACAHLGALEIGEWIKTYIDRNKVKNDIFVGNALIDMYFKCGCVEKAKRVFGEMSRTDKFTWTAMVVGLAINGHGEEAIETFSQMLKMSIQPDEITYLGLLSGCAHTGMVDKGKSFFASMTIQHGIRPSPAHYGCMVDLLGRAGKLKEAYELITCMPIEPSSIIWGALLGACRVHKDFVMAETVAKKILMVEPDNGSVYVSLCNIYAACNRWDDLQKLRREMMDRGIKKVPGCSLIEINGVVNEFVAGDRSHNRSEEICVTVKELIRELKLAGLTPDAEVEMIQ